MADSKVRVAILEDHQSIIDGYMYRLGLSPELQVVGTASCGDDLLPLLASNPADVLLMDVNVPATHQNRNPFPILHMIPRLLKEYPHLRILVISMLTQNTLIDALVEAGIRGYIFKDDGIAIEQLAKIVLMTAGGGVYFSQGAYQKLRGAALKSAIFPLTPRQMQILSICAAYPDITTAELARKLGVASSTFRNVLSSAYLRLNVRTRAAAIAKVQHLGLVINTGFHTSSSEE